MYKERKESGFITLLMSKKLYLLLFLVVIVAVISTFFFINQEQKPEIKPKHISLDDLKNTAKKECENADNSNLCYTMFAIKTKNIVPCLLISQDDQKTKLNRSNCFEEVIASINDVSQCDLIPNNNGELEKIKVECYGNRAYFQKETEICNSLRGETKFLGVSYKDACYASIAKNCVEFWLLVIRNPNPAPLVCKELMRRKNMKSPDDLIKLGKTLE